MILFKEPPASPGELTDLEPTPPPRGRSLWEGIPHDLLCDELESQFRSAGWAPERRRVYLSPDGVRAVASLDLNPPSPKFAPPPGLSHGVILYNDNGGERRLTAYFGFRYSSGAGLLTDKVVSVRHRTSEANVPEAVEGIKREFERGVKNRVSKTLVLNQQVSDPWARNFLYSLGWEQVMPWSHVGKAAEAWKGEANQTALRLMACVAVGVGATTPARQPMILHKAFELCWKQLSGRSE